MAAPLIVRAGPSGKRLAPVNPVGTKSWNGASPLVLELVPLGHRPGLYQFTIAYHPIVLAAGGTYSLSASFDVPTFGASSSNFVTGGNINTAFIAPRHVFSSGRAPLLLTFTPNAVTGSPRLYVNCPADFILASFPADYPS